MWLSQHAWLRLVTASVSSGAKSPGFLQTLFSRLKEVVLDLAEWVRGGHPWTRRSRSWLSLG